jgi:hypothetical protein
MSLLKLFGEAKFYRALERSTVMRHQETWGKGFEKAGSIAAENRHAGLAVSTY